MSGETEIRPFRVDMPDEAIADLRRRIAAARWPSKELVADRSQGVQLATVQELARYWATEYDWRRCEAKLNALPQFTTQIDGVDIHFIHVKSPHADALPLIMTHGWPGSVIELLEVVGPLTDPTAHGGRAEDAFDLVLPSLPGYGFSGEPAEVGWDPGRIARAWAVLMDRLGYTRYVAQGGDQGAGVTDAMGRQAPDGLRRHPPELPPGRAGRRHPAAETSAEERAALDAIATFRTGGFRLLPGAGHAAADDRLRPAGFTRRPGGLDARPRHRQLLQDLPRLPRRAALRGLTRDHILDNITVYWLTGTGASAARSYWEGGRAQVLAAGQARPEVKLPVGFTTFPGEIFRAPRSWVEKAYPTLTYFHEADRGGHFAAWEEPELFATEIRAAFHVAALTPALTGFRPLGNRARVKPVPLVKGEPHELTVYPGRSRLGLRAPNLPEGSPARSPAGTSTPGTCASTWSPAATARRCCWCTAGRRPGTPGGW